MTWDMTTVSRRIFQLRKSLKLTQSAFGRMVGVDQATISKWESDLQLPEGENLFALAKIAKMSAEEFLGTNEIRPAHVINVPVIGAVQAGEWREAIEWPSEDQYEVAVPPHPKYYKFRRFGLVVKGPSMNRVYADGAVVICVAIEDLERDPLPGERVVVERRRADGLIEATVKEFQPDESGRGWLWPMSTHPEHQAPLPMPTDGDGSGVDEVKVTAIVTGHYRHE